MKRHWAYLRYVIRHKRFVYRFGRELGLGRYQLLVHDWTKFLPSEWGPYVEFFYGSGTNQGDFDRAWLRHQHRHPHHWQHWVLPEDDGGTKVLEIPDRYRREMVADWRGAGAALGFPDTPGWYSSNRENMALGPETRAWVERELGLA